MNLAQQLRMDCAQLDAEKEEKKRARHRESKYLNRFSRNELIMRKNEFCTQYPFKKDLYVLGKRIKVRNSFANYFSLHNQFASRLEYL